MKTQADFVRSLESVSSSLVSIGEIVCDLSKDIQREERPIRELVFPDELKRYDPDPDGNHGMAVQRRLDTAFTEYREALLKMFTRMV